MAHFPKATGKSFRDRGGNPPPRNSSLGSLPCLTDGRCVLCRWEHKTEERGERLLKCRLMFGSCFWNSLRLGMFIIPLIMKPLHCSHNSELQLIDFHSVFSVKSYLINAEMCREQLISSRQFLFKWVAWMCFAWGFLERKKGFCSKSLQVLNGKPGVSTCGVQVFYHLGIC